MQEAVLTQELARLDLTKVAALQQKRTLAFVNHFVLTTAQFLNNFMKQCEQKLMQFDRKLEKVEAALVLLETRLSSIPEVDTASTNPDIKTEQSIETVEKDTPVDSQSATEEHSVDPDPTPTAEEKPNPEFARFLKMVQVGVPLEAVKLKVSLEGLDPSAFEKIVRK